MDLGRRVYTFGPRWLPGNVYIILYISLRGERQWVDTWAEDDVVNPLEMFMKISFFTGVFWNK